MKLKYKAVLDTLQILNILDVSSPHRFVAKTLCGDVSEEVLEKKAKALANKYYYDGYLSEDEIEIIERKKAISLSQNYDIQNDDCVELDYIHIAPSCGRGTVVMDDAEVTPIRIGKAIISDIWKVPSPEFLKLFKASGDSMQDTIDDGNLLLVDTSKTDFNNGGVFVLTINNDWFVKRLRLKINGDLEIISDNTKYDVEVLKPNTDINIKVIGKVIKNLSKGL